MKQLNLGPLSRACGEVVLPGSKSLSNRALLLSALASGDTQLGNLLRSDDTQRMVDALRQLGVAISLSEDWQSCLVRGKGGPLRSDTEQELFLGNAGTAIRPLTAVLSLTNQAFIIDGDEFMRERPIAHLVEALRGLGAGIEYLRRDGYPPIRLTGRPIRGGNISIPGGISSQYLTSLLMALPLAAEGSRIAVIGDQVSKPYLDMTLGMLKIFGVHAKHRRYREFEIEGGQQYRSPATCMIEGDASSASYFFGAAAIAGGPVKVHGLGRNSVQGDYQFLDTIEQMGARVTREENWTQVEAGGLKGIDVDLNHIPDAAMTLATLALFAEGRTTIRNIYNWRVKETDRMHAMSEGLRRLGARVETTDDTIIIDPPAAIQPAEIDTWGDHRVAMAFSLAAFGNAEIRINDPDCTRKTFPDYFDVFQSITGS